MKLAIGSIVGARRWPYSHAHPGCWGRPWSGVLLSNNDPRAWTDTLAFPGRCPTQAEVDAHLAQLASRGLDMGDDCPVLWAFDSGPKVYWSEADLIRPYEDDLAEWELERSR